MTLTAPLLSVAELPSSGWTELPPLPDPVGFAGMFAGVSNDILFAGGGSRFADKPAWLGGTKVFSDRIFLLLSPEGPWKELTERLPEPLAHGSCTSFGDDVISVGGVNATGPLKSVVRISLAGSRLRVESLPDFPHPLVYGAASVVADVIYVIGGVADPSSTTPTREFWALALSDSEHDSDDWERLPDFPGDPVIVPAAGSDGTSFYVFGGMGFRPGSDGKSIPEPSHSAHRFDPETRTWTRLRDLPEPRVGAATPTPQLPDGRFLIAGGYGVVFPGAPEKHPGFDPKTFIYSSSTDTWSEGPELLCERHVDPKLSSSPGPEPMVAAPAVIWRNQIVLISGEVRPATRTPAVVGISETSFSESPTR